jgi:hypothetical protein
VILPGKHLSAERCLLGVGGEILAQLPQPRDVSDLWDAFRVARQGRERAEPVPFDWFVTALSFLYTVGAVHLAGGLIRPGSGEP